MNRIFSQRLFYPWMLLFAALVFIFPFMGSQKISMAVALNNSDSLDRLILLQIRLPRVVFAWSVGAGLALVGAVYQVVLRNALASPYTLGVSSGGALGAVLALKLGLVLSVGFISSVALFSIAGSLTAIGLIFFFSRYWKQASMYSIILLGVAFSFFFSAVNMLIHYLADFTETFKMMRWVMGALDVAGWAYPLTALGLTLLGAAYFLFHYRHFNVLLTGEELAKSKGVDVERLQKHSLILGAVLAGFYVALAGPIGFVGLVIPHMIRMMFGANHKYVFLGALMLGGVFLDLSDTIARMLIAPAEIPVGIITAFLGGPFFVFLLLRQSR